MKVFALRGVTASELVRVSAPTPLTAIRVHGVGGGSSDGQTRTHAKQALIDDDNQAPDRKAKIQEAVPSLDASLPGWAKSDWRWQEIVVSAQRFK